MTAVSEAAEPKEHLPDTTAGVRGYVADYLTLVRGLLAEVDPADIERMVDLLTDACRGGRRLVLCGNGGSASTASHLVCDFQKNVYLESGCPWEVLALTDSPALITAWGNDTEYANVFAGQARTWLRKGDVLLAISASGNSPNILRAVEVANEVGAVSVGWSGFGGGKLAEMAQVTCVVHSRNMQMVEDLHMVLGHIVFSALRDRVKGLL